MDTPGETEGGADNPVAAGFRLAPGF